MYVVKYCLSCHEDCLPDVGVGNGVDGELLGLVLDLPKYGGVSGHQIWGYPVITLLLEEFQANTNFC